MWAHVERCGQCERLCSGYVRIFEDDQQLGDGYRYVFPFTMLDDHTIEIHGIVGKEQGGRAPTKLECAAMLVACKDLGWTVIIERKAGAMVGRRSVSRKSYQPQNSDKG